MSGRRLSHVTAPLPLTDPDSSIMSGLTVHHLHISQSERIPFLCEELDIPYTLKIWDRAPLFASEEFKALHPSGSAPVIQDGSLTLAESGACMEYIAHKYADGRLFFKPSQAEYAEFLFWWHWANSTLQATVTRAATLRVAKVGEDHLSRKNVDGRLERQLKALDERLGKAKWLAGDEFSAADIMMVFSLTTVRYFHPYDLSSYGNILAYLERIGQREGYKRAMKKCDPEMKLLLDANPPEKTLM